MKFFLHPKRILYRKLDELVSRLSFSTQNLGMRYLNSKILFLTIKKSNFKYLQANLVLDDELFSKYYHRNMTLSLNSHSISYFIKGRGNKYPSVCNLKYFGKEFLVSNNLQSNRVIDPVIYNKKKIKKIGSRNLGLLLKEQLALNTIFFFFSTVLAFQSCSFKNLLYNEEFVHLNLFIDNLNLVNFPEKKNKLRVKYKETNPLSVIILEFYEKSIIGMYKKNKRFWFECNLKIKNFISSNFLISGQVKQLFSPNKLFNWNFIHILNWNNEKNNTYFLNLKNIIEWVLKEINQGLKETDMNSKIPVGIDNSYFILRKQTSLISSLFSISINHKYESLESQFFSFIDTRNFGRGVTNWKGETICIDNDFNRSFYKINNSVFRLKELNSTFGIDSSIENFSIFNSFQFQKTSKTDFYKSIDLKIFPDNVGKIFNFKAFQFSIGRSTNYSKL